MYAPLGPTHLAIEDLAILRALPNMTVVAVADAEEMRRFMPLTLEWAGPISIRLAKGGDPIVTDPGQPFQIGRAILRRPGRDALFVTTGVLLGPALEAARDLAREGVEAGVLHVHTLKPFDREGFLEACTPVRAVITAEEHTVIGGLGSAAAEALAEAGMARRFRRLGLPDVFPDHYGSQEELMDHYHLNREALERTARERLEGR